tara:strand:+ start:245 stop:514 length:270 start_codon:yes stop_codon:yes gene_type:complete
MLRMVRYYFASEKLTMDSIHEAREFITTPPSGLSADEFDQLEDLLPHDYNSRIFRVMVGWSYAELAEIRWFLIERNAPGPLIDKWKGIE